MQDNYPFSENPFTILYKKIDTLEATIARLVQHLAAKQSKHDPEERLSRKQVSQFYGISFTTIHNIMKKGELPYEKVGRKTLFKRKDVERCFAGYQRGGIND